MLVCEDVRFMDKLAGFWRDDSGALLSSEYLILGTILTIGLIVGISAAQIAINEEFDDYAHAIDGLFIGGMAGSNAVYFGGEESGYTTDGSAPGPLPP